MNTVSDLYEFLQTHPDRDIIAWLDPSQSRRWDGKDKQESLLRLLGGLGLVYKLNDYTMCKGNFNKKTISKNATAKDVFDYADGEPISLNNKGDASDWTGIRKKNKKHLHHYKCRNAITGRGM